MCTSQCELCCFRVAVQIEQVVPEPQCRHKRVMMLRPQDPDGARQGIAEYRLRLCGVTSRA